MPSSAKSAGNLLKLPPLHDFTRDEIQSFRKNLISWYNRSKRNLPWRDHPSDDQNTNAYAEWVSEVMLQQTRVDTVIKYYENWMKRWPTVEALASASLEEVNQVWAGLGYYSRARRLQEGAKTVMEDYKGVIPSTAKELEKLPGIGRYTAAAIASIAFAEPVGVVDGNVMRVLSRLRRIGSNIGDQSVIEAFWTLSNKLVDPNNPGDFNQAMMELGATVCTPKSPSCSSCPVKDACLAYKEVLGREKQSTLRKSAIDDIENCVDNCSLCVSNYDVSMGVMNYPRKAKKASPRKETAHVLLISSKETSETEYLMVQREASGLLANLWEFPSFSEELLKADVNHLLNEYFSIRSSITDIPVIVGQVEHIFSHIHQTYQVHSITASKDALILAECSRKSQWCSKEQLMSSAISTAMKKVFRFHEEACSQPGRKRRKAPPEKPEKQATLQSFFNKKPKKG